MGIMKERAVVDELLRCAIEGMEANALYRYTDARPPVRIYANKRGRKRRIQVAGYGYAHTKVNTKCYNILIWQGTPSR